MTTPELTDEQLDAVLTIKSGPFKGKPQQWFTRAEVRALLSREPGKSQQAPFAFPSVPAMPTRGR